MTVSERARHGLYEDAKRAFSDESADTLMELLPPVGWADVATKRDLDALESRLDHRFEALDHRFEALEQRFEGQLHRAVTRLVMWLVPLNVGLAFGAARLA